MQHNKLLSSKSQIKSQNLTESNSRFASVHVFVDETMKIGFFCCLEKPIGSSPLKKEYHAFFAVMCFFIFNVVLSADERNKFFRHLLTHTRTCVRG